MYPETGESLIDIHQQFVALSKFTVMDTGADQSHPLVQFTFVLALLPTTQIQVREAKIIGLFLPKNRLLLRS